MRIAFHPRPWVIVLSLCAILTSTAAAAPRYRLIDLGDLPGGSNYSFAGQINEYGQIAGLSGATSNIHGFLWQPAAPNAPTGAMIDLGTLPGFNHSQAVGINDLGQIAGHSSGEMAFLWTPTAPNAATGSMIPLGDLPGGIVKSAAFGINNYGQVVGQSTTAAGPTGFLWSPQNPNGSVGGMISLGDFPGGMAESAALRINSSGEIAGYSYAASGQRAFLWRPQSPNSNVGTMIDIGDLPEAGYGVSGSGINDRGQIVGGSNLSGGSHEGRAFLWTPNVPGGDVGSMVYLGDLPGGYVDSYASGLNERGWVVGGSDAGDLAHVTPSHGYLWTPQDGMMDLNDLVDESGANWEIWSGFSINEAGQIAASADYYGSGSGPGVRPTYQRGVLLTPIPEPGVVGLLAVAGVMLLKRRRFL